MKSLSIQFKSLKSFRLVFLFIINNDIQRYPHSWYLYLFARKVDGLMYNPTLFDIGRAMLLLASNSHRPGLSSQALPSHWRVCAGPLRNSSS